jgi:hypothetical protein
MMVVVVLVIVGYGGTNDAQGRKGDEPANQQLITPYSVPSCQGCVLHFEDPAFPVIEAGPFIAVA